MTTAERVYDECRALTPALQEAVLEFVESLGRGRTTPLYDPAGLWADRGAPITEEDLAQARREMWGGFPREDL